MRRTAAISLITVVLLFTSHVGAAFSTESSPVPDQSDKCPVCGMFVERYPYFLASVTYEDGHTDFFDGAKDMFKYLFDLDRYAQGRRAEAIQSIRVTEYYDMTRIDAKRAFFVIGSDVLGPMGHELIPLRSQKDAQQFKKDHKGRRVLPYSQVTPAIIEQLD